MTGQEWRVYVPNEDGQTWSVMYITCGADAVVGTKSRSEIIRYADICNVVLGNGSAGLRSHCASANKPGELFFSIFTNDGKTLDFEMRSPEDRDQILSELAAPKPCPAADATTAPNAGPRPKNLLRVIIEEDFDGAKSTGQSGTRSAAKSTMRSSKRSSMGPMHLGSTMRSTKRSSVGSAQSQSRRTSAASQGSDMVSITTAQQELEAAEKEAEKRKEETQAAADKIQELRKEQPLWIQDSITGNWSKIG